MGDGAGVVLNTVKSHSWRDGCLQFFGPPSLVLI